MTKPDSKAEEWVIDQAVFPHLERAEEDQRVYLCGKAGKVRISRKVQWDSDGLRQKPSQFQHQSTSSPVVLVHSRSDPGMNFLRGSKVRQGFHRKSSTKPQRNFKYGMPIKLLESSFREADVLSGYYRKVLAKSQARRVTKESTKDRRTFADVEQQALLKIRKVAEKSLGASKCHQDLKGFQGVGLLPNELRYRLRAHFNIYLDDRELAAVFQHFDSDEDGTVDFNEMLSQFLHPERLSSDEAIHRQKRLTNVDYYKTVMDKISHALVLMKDKMSLQDLFTAFDADKSGTISRDEFTEALSTIGLDLSYHETKACFLYLDPNNDGSVNCTEFMHAYFNRRTIVSQLRRQERQRSRPPFLPCNPYRAKEAIVQKLQRDVDFLQQVSATKGAKNENIGGANGDRTKDQPVIRDTFKPLSTTQAKNEIARNYYLHSPDEAVLYAQKLFVKERAAMNRARLRETFNKRPQTIRKKH